jgi:hypothetical protein
VGTTGAVAAFGLALCAAVAAIALVRREVF